MYLMERKRIRVRIGLILTLTLYLAYTSSYPRNKIWTLNGQFADKTTRGQSIRGLVNSPTATFY